MNYPIQRFVFYPSKRYIYIVKLLLYNMEFNQRIFVYGGSESIE